MLQKDGLLLQLFPSIVPDLGRGVAINREFVDSESHNLSALHRQDNSISW